MKIWALTVIILLGVSCNAAHYYSVEHNTVIFYLNLSGAKNVYFAHSLDNYIPHRVKAVKDGKWKFAMIANFEFRYFYIIDGSVYLPECQFRETDDFGSENCIFVPKP
jgi:hypothetical protein